MTDKERLTALEARIAQLEARLALVEQRPIYQPHSMPVISPMPKPWPSPWWQSPVTCAGGGGEYHLKA